MFYKDLNNFAAFGSMGRFGYGHSYRVYQDTGEVQVLYLGLAHDQTGAIASIQSAIEQLTSEGYDIVPGSGIPKRSGNYPGSWDAFVSVYKKPEEAIHFWSADGTGRSSRDSLMAAQERVDLERRRREAEEQAAADSSLWRVAVPVGIGVVVLGLFGVAIFASGK